MKYYYADAQNKPVGPVAWEEIQDLIRTNSLKNDPMVIPEGGGEWRPMSACSGAMPGAGPAPSVRTAPRSSFVPFSTTILGDLVAAPLKLVKGWLTENFTNRTVSFCRDTGQLAILAGGALGLIFCFVTAIRGNQLIPALIGCGFLLALAIAQFVAQQFLGAGEALIANTPHRISSQAFLECCGLFALLSAAGVFAVGIIAALSLGGAGFMMQCCVVLLTLAITIIQIYWAAVAFNPRMVNISIGDGGAGEEMIAILGFSLKAYLKLLPILFLILGVSASLLILVSFASHPQPVNAYGGDPFGQASSLGSLQAFISLGGYAGIVLTLIACLLPFIGYLLFLLLNLSLEIIKAILSLTERTKRY